MSDQVQVGIIGTSWWADLIYLPILSQYERADVVAICGRNQVRAQEMADKYHIPKVYTDYRHMIDSGICDAMVIATPDDTHYEMTTAALDAGLHVLCEKPVALNAEHAREMCNRADAAGVKHMVLYTWYWLPALQRIKHLLDTGYIGKPYHGFFHWLAEYARDGAYNWRFDADRANGILGDLGSHLIHMSQWLLGDVTSVSAHMGYHVRREGADGNPSNPANDSFLSTLDFANGAQIQLHVSAVAHVIDSHMQINLALHGQHGSLEAEWHPADLTKLVVQIQGSQGDAEETLEEATELDFVDYLKSNNVGPRLFIDCILDDQPIEPGLHAGYKVQQVIDAALQSHQTGQRIILAQ